MTVRDMELACDSPALTGYPEHVLNLPELTLSKTYYPFGFPLEVWTNSQAILEMNEKVWRHFTKKQDTAPMLSYVYVAPGGPLECPPAQTYQFAKPHLVCIADPQHYVVVDLAHGETVTSITEASLQHPLYIEYFFLWAPLLTIRAQAVHAGCVAWNDRGVLLCGDNGAGKSTLSYACARSGWEYISDDAVFVPDEEQASVTGNCHLVRLRPSAAELFAEIQGIPETPRAAGKPSIELSTHRFPNVQRRETVQVDFIVFLKRSSTSGAQLLPYRKDVARMYMRQGLYGTNKIRERHFAAVERLLRADVFELRYNDLDSAIERLQRLAEDGC